MLQLVGLHRTRRRRRIVLALQVVVAVGVGSSGCASSAASNASPNVSVESTQVTPSSTPTPTPGRAAASRTPSHADVNITTPEGYTYTLSFDSFEIVTDGVQPPNVSFAIHFTVTNTSDRLIPDGDLPPVRDSPFALVVPRSALRESSGGPFGDPWVCDAADACTLDSVTQIDDGYQGIPSGGSVSGIVRPGDPDGFPPGLSEGDVSILINGKPW
jgi:hypothetical protein